MYAQPRYLQEAKRSSAKKATSSSSKQKIPSHSGASHAEKMNTKGDSKSVTKATSSERRGQTAAAVVKQLPQRRADPTTVAAHKQDHAIVISAGKKGSTALKENATLDQSLSVEAELSVRHEPPRSSTIDRQKLQEMREQRMANYFLGAGKKPAAAPASVKRAPQPKLSQLTSATPSSAVGSTTKERFHTNAPQTTTVRSAAFAARKTLSTKKEPQTAQLLNTTKNEEDGDDEDTLNSTIYQQPERLLAPVAAQADSVQASLPLLTLTYAQTETYLEQNSYIQALMMMCSLEEAHKAQEESALESLWLVSQHLDELRRKLNTHDSSLNAAKVGWMQQHVRQTKAALLGRSHDLETFERCLDSVACDIERNATKMPMIGIGMNKTNGLVSRVAASSLETVPAALAESNWSRITQATATLQSVTRSAVADISRMSDTVVGAAGFTAVESSLLAHSALTV